MRILDNLSFQQDLEDGSSPNLCDSGAGCNLMPSSITDQLGITNLSLAKGVIVLADESQCIPRGELYDEIIELGGVNVVCDFTVCDLHDGDNPQLLFGCDFLYSVGAVIDWPRRRMSLTFIDSRVFYYALPPHATHLLIPDPATNIRHLRN